MIEPDRVENVAVGLAGDPRKDPEAARKVHTVTVTGAVYANALAVRIGELFGGEHEPADSALVYVEDFLRRMEPRDPLEETLMSQAILAHARVLHLTDLATKQLDPDQIRIMNEYADKASNTFRRLMLALAEYRRPPRSGDTFTAINQANIAQQQVVMHGPAADEENTTNEQGSTESRDTASGPPELPAHAEGTGLAPGLGQPREAVGAVHRPKNTRGKGSEPDERLETR